MTRVLVTNDDGVESPGLHVLARAARDLGLDVTIAAPAEQSSGSSAGILGAGPGGHIGRERRTIAGLEDVPAWAVRANPGLISLIAAHGAFGDAPDLVLSGINHGANVGRAILHSGTVGAALTGGVNGARGIALSLDVGMTPNAFHWEAAAIHLERLVPFVAAQPVGTVLNLNVPNSPGPHILSAAGLAPFGIVQTTGAVFTDDDVQLTIADPADEFDPGTDAAMLASGYATLTSISGIGERALPPF